VYKDVPKGVNRVIETIIHSSTQERYYAHITILGVLRYTGFIVYKDNLVAHLPECSNRGVLVYIAQGIVDEL
jgi:hypothetical protein